MMEEAVTANHIAQVVSRWTGVPVDRMLEGEKEKLLKMEEALSRRVVGQAEAVHAVATAVRRSRAGLQDPNRPMGSFMFLGPTGVGKTELTKALAEYLFDNEHAMVRLDMSEYMEKHSVSRLIGAPPGYVGYDEGGAITEAVRRRPYQVVLFDEIEKAHPDVFNLLLQISEDGRLTDSQGRIVDFKNTVIIMTSNIGSAKINPTERGMGIRGDSTRRGSEAKEYEAMKARVMDEMKKTFRPEFLNRVDEVIVFPALKRDEIFQIVDLMIARVNKQVRAQELTLEISHEVKEFIANEGFDPTMGARPLRRAIQRLIEDPLAEEVLRGTFRPGDVIRGEMDGERVTFRRLEPIDEGMPPPMSEEPVALA
jgi:ATP-dependent Clp protease ATP-binding subunit ClpA